MDFVFGGIGLIFAVIFLAPFIIIPIVIFLSARNIMKFQTTVFNGLDKELFQKIDQSDKPNKDYVKTKCDNCGAKCTNASDISPSGDLKCEYCNSWFNVLRT